MEVTWWGAFLYGLVGSFTVEVYLYLEAFGPKGGLPGKYKSGNFWCMRCLLAVLSGIVATAYFLPQQHPALYIHVGVATPAILLRFSKDDQPVKSPTP
jgi:hypothetical protein